MPASHVRVAGHADQAGNFDYYVLSLSWSPTYCADDGKRGRDNLQCYSDRAYGFVVHGLWPQYDRGYPDFCRTNHRKPSENLVDQMLKFSPSRSLVHHEWKKHGTCSGLKPLDYFRLSVRSFKKINKPEQLGNLKRPLLMTVDQIRNAFLEANPGMPRDALVITCKRKKLHEVRICLDKKGEIRHCAKSAFRGECRTRDKLRILAIR